MSKNAAADDFLDNHPEIERNYRLIETQRRATTDASFKGYQDTIDLRDAVNGAKAALDEFDRLSVGFQVDNDVDADGVRVPRHSPLIVVSDPSSLLVHSSPQLAASRRQKLVREYDRAVEAKEENDSRQQKLAAASQHWGRAHQAVDDFLSAQPRGSRARIAKEKGPVSEAALPAAWQKSVALIAEINAVSEARPPLEEVHRQIDDDVAERIKAPFQYVPSNDRPRTAGGQLRPHALRWLEPAGSGGEGDHRFAEALALWLAPDKVADELKRQASAIYSDGRLSLSSADRARRLQKLRVALHTQELEEGRLILALARQGLNVIPRPNISPKALLQILD